MNTSFFSKCITAAVFALSLLWQSGFSQQKVYQQTIILDIFGTEAGSSQEVAIEFTAFKVNDLEYSMELYRDTSDTVKFTIYDLQLESFNTKFWQKLKELLESTRTESDTYNSESITSSKEEIKREASKLFANVQLATRMEDDTPLAGYINLANKVKLYSRTEMKDLTIKRNKLRRTRRDEKYHRKQLLRRKPEADTLNLGKSIRELADPQKSLSKEQKKELDSLIQKYKRYQRIVRVRDHWVARLKKKINLKDSTSNKLVVDSVQIEFHEGKIENITVIGYEESKPNNKLKFTNGIPIPFSSQKNFDKLDRIWLWEDNFDNYNIRMSDVTPMYQEKLYNNNYDYSPGDITLTLGPGANQKLYKTQTSQLFSARVFSDFFGLDEDEPNGLVQTEISKRINANPYRRKVGDPRVFNYGWFQYLEPIVVVSKLENHNRRIEMASIDSVSGGNLFRRPYVSTLALFQHQNLYVGGDINIISLQFRQIKSVVNIGAGLHFGRVAFQDSTKSIINDSIRTSGFEKFGVNTVQFSIPLRWEFKPDPRFGFSASFTPRILLLADNRLTQVGNEETFVATTSHSRGDDIMSKSLFTTELFAMFRPNAKIHENDIFLRYRFTFTGNNSNTNFHQAQIGYAFKIITNSENYYKKLAERSQDPKNAGEGE